MLSRKVDESIVVELPDGELITVTIVGLDGRRARVGFDAPLSAKILRGELRPAP